MVSDVANVEISMKAHKSRRIHSGNVMATVLITLLALAMLFPFYWMAVASFLPDAKVTNIPPILFPQSLYLRNYEQLFLRAPTLTWFYNSVFVSAMTAFLVVAVGAMAGYSFAKKRFFLRDVIFYIMVATIMIPRQILIVPLFKVIQGFDLFNNHWGLILPMLGWPVGVFMLKQFMVTLPSEIMEAAKIDGCSEIGIFLRVVIPLAKPGIGALAIFTFINSWNDYMWQFLVISSKALKTLPQGIATFQEEFSARYGLQMAGAVMATLPMVIIFLMFQKYFTKGITMGSIKG